MLVLPALIAEQRLQHVPMQRLCCIFPAATAWRSSNLTLACSARVTLCMPAH